MGQEKCRVVKYPHLLTLGVDLYTCVQPMTSSPKRCMHACFAQESSPASQLTVIKTRCRSSQDVDSKSEFSSLVVRENPVCETEFSFRAPLSHVESQHALCVMSTTYRVQQVGYKQCIHVLQLSLSVWVCPAHRWLARGLLTSAVGCKNNSPAGHFKITPRKDLPLTYEQSQPPYRIGVTKGWNSWNASTMSLESFQQVKSLT